MWLKWTDVPGMKATFLPERKLWDREGNLRGWPGGLI